ncbi:methyltransferase [Candidatus Bathyarchaeota archaeon]|nr:methyltransferase [Candidatus Bathyarchaeota archaeon]
MVKFKEKLKEYLADELTGEESHLLPSGFQTLEDVIIINLKPELLDKKHLIANAYLELLPYIKSVWAKTFGISKVVGKFRTPTGLEHLAGEKKSVVEVVENGVIFKHDFTQVIFSKGNIAERSYLPSRVQPGETILDMFAGIGYFSLMIGKLSNPASIHAIEINPVSFKFLVENIELNNLEDVIIPHEGDCAEVVPQLDINADRIIMGVFPAPRAYLPIALDVVNKNKGTIIHYEGKVTEQEITPLYNDVVNAVNSSEVVSHVELLEHRFVKNVGIRQQHAVIDVRVS